MKRTFSKMLEDAVTLRDYTAQLCAYTAAAETLRGVKFNGKTKIRNIRNYVRLDRMVTAMVIRPISCLEGKK